MFSFHEKVKIISLCPILQKLYGRNFRHGINKRGENITHQSMISYASTYDTRGVIFAC